MKLVYNKIFLEHNPAQETFETKQRLESLGDLQETKIDNGKKYLKLVHTKDYIKHVKKSCKKGEPLNEETFTSKKSYEAAIRAVGATIMASETNDFAIVRPPGHHAYPSKASGFCLFNNIAIATQKLVNEGKRVFIFDVDGHFGDGTSYWFYKSDKALYMSLHQYPAFPDKGTMDEIGEDKGKGYNINVPLPPKTGDDVYMNAVTRFIPIAEQFKPDVVAVSAGFDACQYDPILEMRLSYNTYYE